MNFTPPYQYTATRRQQEQHGVFVLEVNDYLKIFIGILAILNPLGALPMYLSLTQHHSEQDKKAVALTAAKGATIILLVTLFFGEFDFRVFRHFSEFVPGRWWYSDPVDGDFDAACPNQWR